jgi:hypothetical protein
LYIQAVIQTQELACLFVAGLLLGKTVSSDQI